MNTKLIVRFHLLFMLACMKNWFSCMMISIFLFIFHAFVHCQPPGSDGGLISVDIETSRLVDEEGRERIFHGTNSAPVLAVTAARLIWSCDARQSLWMRFAVIVISRAWAKLVSGYTPHRSKDHYRTAFGTSWSRLDGLWHKGLDHNVCVRRFWKASTV